MEEDRDKGESTRNAKKPRSEFDFDKCLELSTDDPPPELIVVKGPILSVDDHSSPPSLSGEAMEKIRGLSEKDIEEAIRRMNAQISGGFCSKLPDKGDKYRANLKWHQDEMDRRRRFPSSTLQASNEFVEVEEAKRSKPSGVSDEAKKEAPSCQPSFLSEFACRFTAKLAANSASGNLELVKENVVCDAFDKDLKSPGRSDRRKGKQKKGRLTPNEKQKSGLSGKGKEKTKTISLKTFFRDQSDPAENNERHKQKDDPRDDRQRLRADRSNSKKTVVLLDEEEEEEPDVGCTAAPAQVEPRDTTIYYPSREDPECVEIQSKDLNCLAPGEYLTSTIMNFYIRFLQGPSFAANNAPNDYHFFSTYFYKKLQESVLNQVTDKESSFVKLRRWWRGVQIFQKAYIFLPVHDNLHWSLAIVCIPDKADESGPIILHLDSLGYHSSKSIFQNIRRLLKEEWEFVKEVSDYPDVSISTRIWKNLPRRIEDRIITVPQQNNDFDCGIFVLHFIERFIEDAPPRLRKEDLGMFRRRWFKPEEASNLRGKIKSRLTEEFQKLNNQPEFEPVNLPSNGELVESPEASSILPAS